MPTLFEVFLHGLKNHQAGVPDEAEKAYKWVIANDPRGALTAKIMLASLAPVIYRSIDEMHEWRAKTQAELQKLVDSGQRLDLTREWAPHNFFSAYHGYDDRPEQELRAKLFLPPRDVPQLTIKHRSDGRLRLGMSSAYFKDHTIGKLNIGLLKHVDRKRFHITVISTAPNKDAVAQQYRSLADAYVELPNTPLESRKVLGSLDLDALYYADIGMNPMTFSHGFSRIARLQCVTWGHPLTTGIPTIDHFISSQHLDASDGQRYYTENLVRLPDIAVAYEPPPAPAKRLTRAELGLPADSTIYGCLQSLYKIHPQFDPLLGDILRRDPKGVVLFLTGLFPHWDRTLRERFARTIPDVASRIYFAPRQDREGFLALNALCDLMLDPLHFGGGNTSWEALSLHVPIVTLPSAFLRGRITYALYQALGYTDLCATDEVDYVNLAVRVGTDSDFRAQAKSTLASNVGRILNRTEGIQQFEGFLDQRLRM